MGKKLRFKASGSDDVVKNRVYLCPAAEDITHDSPYVDVGNLKDAQGYITIVLAELDLFKELDGQYDIGVSSIDDQGNLGEIVRITDVPLDFRPPDPISDLSIVD